MHISDQKQQLRTALEERLLRMSPRDRERESRSLCRRILERLPQGSTICAYWPLKTEADVRPIIEEILKRKDPLFLPRFDNALTFKQCTDLSLLKKGALGIMEPPHDAPLLDAMDSRIVVLVPARGYDRSGNRLGRGNGGYDIWMEKQRTRNPATVFWGIALECQIVPSVPRETHDQHVDAVITARGWIEPEHLHA